MADTATNADARIAATPETRDLIRSQKRGSETYDQLLQTMANQYDPDEIPDAREHDEAAPTHRLYRQEAFHNLFSLKRRFGETLRARTWFRRSGTRPKSSRQGRGGSSGVPP